MLGLRGNANWFRLIGLGLLAVLLWRVDPYEVAGALGRASPSLLIGAFLLNLPQVWLKAYRWRWLLRAQHISYGIAPSTLAYFASIFVGLLTPGRLGEFVKTLYVSQDCGVSRARAFASVLVDRLFDLYALLIVGSAAVLSLSANAGKVPGVLWTVLFAALLTLPLAMLVADGPFERIRTAGLRGGRVARNALAAEGWLLQLRSGLKALAPPTVLAGAILTVLAYVIFFGQCYLLALALSLPASVVHVSYGVALGSLVTLLPISISGLGTRETAIVAYLKTAGIPPEQGLGFSILLFGIFYVGGAVLGAVAWAIKPVPVRS